MRLLEVSMENFKSVQKKVTMDLASRGLVLIVGDNGVGKTTLPDAIVWCLFGKTTRGDMKDGGATGDDVVNQKVGRDCCVSLRFEDDHDQTWVVERYRKHYEEKNRLVFYSNSTNRTQHMTEDTEREIEKVTHHTYTSFMTSVVFGQGMLAPFSAMRPAQQDEIIDTIIGVDILQLATDVTRELMREKKTKLQEIESELSSSTARLQELREDLRNARQEEAQAEEQHAARVKELEDDVAAAKERLKKAILEQEKAKGWEERATQLKETLKTAKKELSDQTLLVGHIEATLRAYEKRITHYQKKKPGMECLECGATISKTSLETTLAELEKNQKASKKELDLAKTKLVALDTYATETATAYTKAATRAESGASVRDATDAVERTETRLVRLQEAPRAVLGAVAKVRERITKTKQTIANLETKQKRLFRKLAYLKHAEQEFGESIRLDVQETILTFLNQRTKRASELLTDGLIDVQFTTTKINKSGSKRAAFGVTATNQTGANVYKLQSRGERQKVDIIVAYALMSLSREQSQSGVNVTIFDELFDGLTDAATDRVVDFLHEELRNNETILIITHKDALKSQFSNIIEVTKDPKSCGTLYLDS